MKNGYSVVELVVIIVIFSVVYFTATFFASREFNINYDEAMYEQKITAIEAQAKLYGENTSSLFEESNSVYLTIEELALANIIINNEEGVVNDPRDDSKTLNNLKVKITNEDNKVTAKVLG